MMMSETNIIEISEAEFQHDLEYYMDRIEEHREIYLILKDDGNKVIACPVDMVSTEDD
jgi:hypothetical protein|tara:strand:+ start:984 stop:1157 length:174 start_codon:yes stop_codon:yes gene_type:complete